MASYSESYQLKLIFFKDTVFLEKNNNTWYREIVKKNSHLQWYFTST